MMKKQLTVNDFRKALQGRIPGIQESRGVFAILVPLVELDGVLHLLFEFRASTLRPQPSEVCFPGGRIESGETPVEAAIRETWEEIGIPAKNIEVIAPLDIIQEFSGREIHPILAHIKNYTHESLKINKDEVEEVFLVPLSFLQEHAPYLYTSPLVMEVGDDFPYEKIGFPEGYRWRRGSVEVPIYEYEGHKIWGLTARTVRWLLNYMERADCL
ncbi:MAG: putative nudix hydrolase YeaB [Firmicutes bacterium]|nr:putative nudix hydrolase YeaB [Bacillota bacterium]